VAGLGAPFRAQLGQWIEEDRLDAALKTFVAAFVSDGMALLKPLPGARKVLSDLRRRAGYSVVITGRRTRVARACLRHCGLPVGAVVGGLVGTAKAPAMREHRIDAYVGDTTLDMHGAREAGVTGVGVLGGTHTAAELTGAGATTVISALTELSGWLT
jgi:phosphoglycolate phosphatase-like HAD superfamily hydrolase